MKLLRIMSGMAADVRTLSGGYLLTPVFRELA
jgi:hypothetical protein